MPSNTSNTRLVRGIPATSCVRDKDARRVLDAIIENLNRLANVESTLAAAATTARQLLNVGSGAQVLKSSTPTHGLFRTLRTRGQGLSVTTSGNEIVFRHTPSPEPDPPPGPAVVPVALTAKVDDHTYTGNAYGDGRHNAATESSVTIKVGAIAAGETLPTSGDYAWFVAHKEKWDVGGNDVEYWTIQPEILR